LQLRFAAPLPTGPARSPRGERSKRSFSDDLVRGVALDPFGAGIPAHDQAFRVDHEDRVIANSIEEHLILLLAISERLVRGLAHGAAAIWHS
jgi:hypothetical protein